jgi:hypothetical protein
MRLGQASRLTLAALACACGSPGGKAVCVVECTSNETFVNALVMDAAHQPVAGVTFTKDGSPTPLPAAPSSYCPLADGGPCSSYRVDLGSQVTGATLKATAPNGASASAQLQGSLTDTVCCGHYSTLDEQQVPMVVQ